MSDYPKVEVPESCCEGKKNEDLEKIKQHAYVLGGDEPETIGQQSAGIIIAAAERMAAEIERLKKHEETSNYLLGSAKDHIDRLKAELEKRREVVRCGECNFKEWCRKSINKDGYGDMCPLSFCSVGQRRESEEKKMKKTARGFHYKNFEDRYGQKCSIQKSSLATEDAIWLGVENTGPQMGNKSVDARMHLTQKQVKKLLPILKIFVETGELEARDE